MKEALNLVRGAVSTKDLLPVLTHFHIHDGRVQGGNGRVAIDAPCPELAKFSCTVPAEPFLKAIDACEGEPKIKLTEGGHLTVSRAKFRATLPLADHSSFPVIKYEAALDEFNIVTPIIPVLLRLLPFVNTDRSRPWVCGVLFRDNYAWATNNIVLARVPYVSAEIMVPATAIDELLRIEREPRSISQGDNWIIFNFDGDWWLRAQKVAGEWPNIAKCIPSDAAKRSTIKAALMRDAVRKILPFCPDPARPIVCTGPKGVSTLDGEMSATVGHDGLPESRWHADSLLAALDAAEVIQLDAYPNPCYWRGAGIDGIIVGVK